MQAYEEKTNQNTSKKTTESGKKTVTVIVHATEKRIHLSRNKKQKVIIKK